MLDRQHGEVIFVCDNCDDILRTGEDEFELAMNELREAGWSNERIGREWLHLCGACQ
jgi:hypothetical protein